LPPKAAEELISNTAYKIAYYQKRNRQARQSHTKTRARKLLEMGIDLTTTRRRRWDTDYHTSLLTVCDKPFIFVRCRHQHAL
jgi:hypothetical protein